MPNLMPSQDNTPCTMVVPTSSCLLASTPKGESIVDSIKSNVEKSIKIVQDSSASGSGFNQIIANVLAGEYNAVNAKLDELTASAPCIMFTWQLSPSVKNAIATMELVGADVKLVRLDA